MTAFNADAIGQVTTSSDFELEAQAGIDYARATNDPIHNHLTGEIIPPVYAVVPVWEKVFEVVSNVVPEEHFFSVVHGEQDMIFHSTMKPGMTLTSTAVGECISVKESGTTLIVKSLSSDATTQQLVTEQYFTMFFRGVNGENSVGEMHDNGLDKTYYEEKLVSVTGSEIVGQVTAHMDDDQTQRYAQASNDYMPIHLDDEFAKSVGLPGIIIHGLCSMAHASWAAIESLCDGDTSKLERIALRFSKPLLPGDDLTTTFISDPNNSRFLFQSVRASDQTPILTNAFVQVRD